MSQYRSKKVTVTFEPKYATCNDLNHTAERTLTKLLDRCYLSDIIAARYTGAVNVVVLKDKTLRLAYETDDYAVCGQRINGHCHLGKVDGVQQPVRCAGQWHFINGQLKQMTNATGTYRPNCKLTTSKSARAHRDNMYQAAVDCLGKKKVKGVDYIAFDGETIYRTHY